MSGTTPAQRIRAWLTHSAYVFRTARDPDLVHKVGPVDGAWQELRRSDLQAALDRLDAMALDAVAREKRVRAMEGDVARVRPTTRRSSRTTWCGRCAACAGPRG